jgi:two-component system OmpR family sensor kinase
MFNSLKSRLWLTYFLIIILLLTAVGLGVLVTLRNNPLLYRQPLGQLETAVNMTSTVIAGVTDPMVLKSQIQTAAERSGIRLALYELDGKLVADSAALPGNRIELTVPRKDSIPGEVNFIDDVRGRSWLYSLKQISGRHYVLAASLKPRIPLALLLKDELFKPLVRAGVIAMLAAIALAIILGNWVEAPLQKLVNQSDAVTRGEAQPIPPEGPSEVRRLFTAFNNMVLRLNASQQSERDFIANVSHELKTPLTSIQGFAQAILDQQPAAPPETEKSASIILDEARRMNKMVIGLLTLARLDAGITSMKVEVVNLQALLQNVLEKLTPQAKSAGVILEQDLRPVPEILADAENLTQVFVNLVENGIKYSKQEGGQVRVSLHQRDDLIEVHVLDNGRGIPLKDQARIFERFYQTDKARSGGPKRGVGLGLSIASQLVKAMGGTLSVESEAAGGCDFMVKLPLA